MKVKAPHPNTIRVRYILSLSYYFSCSLLLPPFFLVRDQDVTMIQYIGELYRYLVHAPEDPRDKDHKVRLMFGNGMRPDVWRKFQQRFGVETVFESYTMSEGKKKKCI